LFLLVPALVELGIDRVFARAAGEGNDEARATLYHLLALQCIGGANATRAARDRGPMLFADVLARPLGSVSNCPTIASPESAVEDIEWFTLAGPGGILETRQDLDAHLAAWSARLMQHFAWKLGAFAGSSPQYLFRNFISAHAQCEVRPTTITVRFLTCPMQVVLRMAGFGRNQYALPWLGDRRLEFRFD
jgi:hypothetical protein